MIDKRLAKALINPRFACLAFIHKLSPFIKNDKLYLQIVYWLSMGKRLNLKAPKTFNEKLQWLKLYNREPKYTIMVDKVKAKEWVANIIGKEHIIPTLGVWNNPEDIDFSTLPNQFVLKCNHNSGLGMCICLNKNNLNIEKVKAKLQKGLQQNFYMTNREWPYKNVPRKILAEKFMQDSSNSPLTDYKFFCFNGEPYMMYVSHDNAEHTTTDFFDMDYNHLSLRMKDPNSTNPPSCPKEFEEMKSYAKKLSKDIPHLRVDFYIINHTVYVGELTFFHNSGLTPMYPKEWEYKLGDLINIIKK